MTRAWINGTLDNYGVTFRASETDVPHLKGMCSMNRSTDPVAEPCDLAAENPTYSVTYNSYPTVNASTVSWTPRTEHIDEEGTTTYYTRSATPTLSAFVADPDGDTVKAVFDVIDESGTVVVNDLPGSEVTNASGGTSTKAVPAGVLTNGTKYTVIAKAQDATVSSRETAPSLPMLIDTTAPQAADVYAPDHPAQLWSGKTTGTFFWDSPAEDVAGYRYGLDTNPPTTYTTDLETSLSITHGAHTLYVRPVDIAGNLGPVRAYPFGVGASATAPGAASGLSESPATTRDGNALVLSETPAFTASAPTQTAAR